ncbi:MAG: glycosyltransferase family 4 protein [Spirochaetales bacterium]|nr:glycosyltransferase family 4 protein [Spirochaetales bacterium]MCF7937741.1 glycosyltransferase family 4 protein [Spirochaetales bacterium]
MNKQPVVLIAANTSWSLYNFRLNLMRSIVKQGMRLVLTAPRDLFWDELAGEFEIIETRHLQRDGMSIINDLRLFREYGVMMKRLRPDVLLSFTVKPNVYAVRAAYRHGARVIPTVNGLGSAFGSRNLVSSIIRLLYRKPLRVASAVVFHNTDDRDQLVSEGLVEKTKCMVTPGSGVDLQAFRPSSRAAGRTRGPENDEDVTCRFLYFSRLLVEKGARDYVEAARRLKSSSGENNGGGFETGGVPAADNLAFSILGPASDSNPSAVHADEVNAWKKEGVVEYLGTASDVRPYLENHDVVVFPSYYREGIPRVLLEALAAGKPIITTDWIGCRETVREGKNGFLVPVRDVSTLAGAMERMARLTPEERAEMGKQSRLLAESVFDEKNVIKTYLDLIKK